MAEVLDHSQNLSFDSSLDAPSRGVEIRAIALSSGPAVALGLARFGYALLLPSMRGELHWSFTQAGGMNTANALGYLIGTLLAAPLTARLQSRRAFLGALVLTAFSLLFCGFTGNFSSLLILRLMAGLSGAIVFVAGAILASHLASQREEKSGLVLGLYFGGVGLGILLTGLGIPPLLNSLLHAWRYAWIGMGILSLLAVFPARWAAATIVEPASKGKQVKGRTFSMVLAPSLAAYFLFGAGYIIYMTFVIAFLHSQQIGRGEIMAFWSVLGASTMACPFVWGGWLSRITGGRAVALRLAVVAAGAAIPIFSTSPAALLISAILFGGAFLSIVSAIVEIIRRGLPAHLWAGGITLITIIFSLGQTLGPIGSGALIDAMRKLSGGLILSATLLLLGTLLALLQGDVRSQER